MDDLMEMWEKKLNSVGAGTPALDAFLGLSVYDMRNAALNIDCPFCKRHMLLEAEEIFRVLEATRSRGNRPHSHGLAERMRTLLTSFAIVANVLLGGLRRAGVI
jgi:hypothetical protein